MSTENFDFSKGNWEVYIVIGEGTEKERNKAHNYYSDDEKIIDLLLSSLILSKDTVSSGFTHYTQEVILINNGKIAESINLLSSIGKVNINDAYFNYNPADFYSKTRKLKKVEISNFTINNRTTAIQLRDQLKQMNGVFLREFEDTLWTHFEGKLLFSIESKDSLDFQSRKQNIEEQIEAALQNEAADFKLCTYVIGYPSINNGMIIDKYYLYSSNEIVKSFRSNPIIHESRVINEINFMVYGVNYKTILKILKSFN